MGDRKRHRGRWLPRRAAHPGTEQYAPVNALIDVIEGADERIYSLLDPEVLPGLTYEYRISAKSVLDEEVVFGPYVATIPSGPSLQWAFNAPTPNPMRVGSGVSFAFTAGTRGPASVVVYDARGREVARPFDRTVEPGAHVVSWSGRGANGSRLGSGIYLVVFRGGAQEIREKVVLFE